MAFQCGRGVQFSTCCGQQNQQQGGGSGPMPLRWYNPNAVAFPTCSRCGQFACSCTHPCVHCNQQPCVCPVNCIKCGKLRRRLEAREQYGGGVRQNGAGCCGNNVYKYRYFNDFGRMDDHFQYNSDNMSQQGGGAIGAPFYVFTSEKPIRWNYEMEGTPVFDKVGHNRFWY